uniref:amino acid adenylation domain-containing protein n=1 Tax=Chitinophaga sp. TaxID=1869181 RepID=UPI0031DADD9A
PGLTASKFIERGGKRVYRTGDLAKWLPDGTIYYMGRMDDQVKIRGNRIEPGEIESCILGWGHAEQAGVVVKGDGNHKYLLAYVVPGAGYSRDALYSYLGAHLPEYMVPGIIMELDTLPLTSSGKLNRKALPEPVIEAPNYVAPGSEVEQELAAIWQKVLGVEKVSVHDNFFRIGGDSIMAIRLVSKINKHFNTSLSIAGLYQNNTVSKLAATLFDNTYEQAHITDKLLNEIAALQSIAGEDDTIEEVYPMRDIQKGMVALSSINPESGMYHDQFIYHLPSVDIAVLQLAFERLVEKHSTLRSCFDLTGFSQELQIVKRTVPVVIIEKDVRNEDPEAAVKHVMAAERKRPFDTRHAPLWRIHLFRLSATNDLLLFQFHHAILDGWSVASLYTELFQVYNHLLINRHYKPAMLQISGRQAVVSEWVEKNSNGHISFWQNELKGYQRLGLFTKSFYYQTYSKQYQPSFKAALLERCAEDGIPLKSLMYGALVYVMHLLSGENDFVLGMVNNNRPVAEDGDKLLGCFLNTTPVRNNFGELAGNTIGSYFKAVDKKLHSLKPYERTTLYDIAKALNEKSAADSPFFDVLYNYIDFHVLNELAGNKNSEPATNVRTFESTNTALGLTVNASGEGLVLTYTLNRELKIDFSAARIHQYVEGLLEAFVRSPGRELKTLCLVPEDEQHTLLYTFNNTRHAFDETATVLDLFAAEVARVPDHTALVYEGESLTYRQLDERSSQLAHYLVGQGVQQGDLVPLFLERSADMIIAIFAVLKAGAAYLPVDINNPPDRILFMLEDCAARFVISKTAFNTWFKDAVIAPLYLDLVNYASFPAAIAAHAKDPRALAYVIYTSGSTGKPKGVQITHYSLVARLSFYKRYYALNEQDKILFYRSFSFDGAIEEYLLPFTTGATCIIAGAAFRQDVFRNMITFIETFRITKVNMPPVLLQDIIELLPDEQVDSIRSLRHVVSGGDKLNVEVVNSFYKKMGADTHINLYNSYGPTENTIDSTILKCSRGLKYMSIGSPVENTAAYILDQHGQLLPLGVAGELCVSGAGLSTGYLNRPELTAEKFVPHPFKEGAFMYKTGDLARWLPNGEIAFIGRIDNQVKIRGHRIEPGEIEAVALQSGCIDNIVVLVKEDASLRKYLVAYVIPGEGYGQALLFQYLKAHLPEYMVPGMIIEMQEFPVTNNGKVDRNSFPEPGERVIDETTYVAPENDTEQRIAAVWQQLLHLPQIGVQDNFFQLGGDSLTIVKLQNGLQKAFDVPVNIVDLFNNTTVREQALLFRQEERPVEEDVAVETLRF